MVANAITTATIEKKINHFERIESKSASTETGKKYAYKSAGQPELLLFFEHIKNLMLPYVKGTIQMTGGDNGQMALVIKKSSRNRRA